MFVLGECDVVALAAEDDARGEGVRFRDFVERLQIAGARRHDEDLSHTAGTQRFDNDCARCEITARTRQPEAGRSACFENFKSRGARAGRQRVHLVVSMMIVAAVAVVVPCMAVTVMVVPAAEQENTGHVDDQSEHGDGYRFVVADRNGPDEAGQRLVADQERNHGEDDGAGEPCEVAELASAEREACVFGVPARIIVGDRGE